MLAKGKSEIEPPISNGLFAKPCRYCNLKTSIAVGDLFVPCSVPKLTNGFMLPISLMGIVSSPVPSKPLIILLA
jgi:hypothetical protein